MNEVPYARYPQLAKEALVTGRVRGTPENRLWAKAIDFILILFATAVVSAVWAPASWVVCVLLWMNVDRMGRGQSPGKWLLGLHTIEVKKGERIKLYNGLIRNIPFIQLNLGLLWGGWFGGFLVLVALAWLLLECYFTFQLRSGTRVGDILGYTRVFDYKDIHTQFIEQFLVEEKL